MKNYEKKYKDLVKAVKELQEANPSDEGIQNWVNENVPELAESEGEQIRKEIIRVFKGEISFTSEKENEKYIAWLEKQKPDGWSEEDENMCLDLIQYFVDGYGLEHNLAYTVDWLKFLKDRVGCEVNCTTTKQWSEDDERIRKSLIASLSRISADTRTDSTSPNYSYPKEIDWLKSLKERYTWKPSEEQIGALEHFVRSIGESGFVSPYEGNTNLVYSLLSELKKLREE